jgi:riboflavin kinase/FMN adenylyltransferase
MKIVYSADEINISKKTVITVGTFDGVHPGHRKLFEKVVSVANQRNFQSIIITFDPHPRNVLQTDKQVFLLTLKNEKIEILSGCNVDFLYIINFTKEFSQQSYDSFVEEFLVKKLKLGVFVIGHDHKFGKDRSGDENKLKELSAKYNFEVEVVEPVIFDNEIISSTKIRNSLVSGDVKRANKLLAREYSFSGNVVHGSTRGRILGFPTANIQPESTEKLLPLGGVYAVRCLINEAEYFGIMNIGFRPTFEEKGKLVFEVHIFDFNADIYGEEIKISFIERLRDEKKFSSKEELIYQIERDKKKAIQIISTLIN